MASKIKYKPFVLPSDFTELDNYILSNKKDLTRCVLDSIEFALIKKLPTVEVFNFKNSEFVIALSHEYFRENINNIYDFYITEELYELCPRAKQVEALLDNKSPSNEKRKKTPRYESDGLSKEQDQESD